MEKTTREMVESDMLKTKILCTMGPSCDSIEVLGQMLQAGMGIARLNMAHGELEEHQERIRRIRTAASEQQKYIPILLDIKGPEVRIGKLKEPYVELVKGQEVTLTTEQLLGDSKRISVNYADMPKVVGHGSKILLDDGLIELTVTSTNDQDMVCRIVTGGTLKPRKGVNLPGVKTTLPGITERDVHHIHFGLENGVDIIAVSFVRKADDILEVRRILAENQAEHVQIISKIENDEGVTNIDEIIEVSDGIMVARGDLGVEIPVEDVPLIQKLIINKCNEAGKPVIVATHMLESMQVNPRPTRAEVTDVSTAVQQGADVVMLSGETAAGKYPVESVRTMATIAAKTEHTIDFGQHFSLRRGSHSSNVTEIISQAVVSTSLELHAKVIVTPTESGFTARMVSKYRPEAPILAITPNPQVLPKLCLLWGVIPVVGESVETTDAMFQSAMNHCAKLGFVEKDDYIVISAGVPLGESGKTNLIKVHQM
jgi:pyruvate kinase